MYITICSKILCLKITRYFHNHNLVCYPWLLHLHNLKSWLGVTISYGCKNILVCLSSKKILCINFLALADIRVFSTFYTLLHSLWEGYKSLIHHLVYFFREQRNMTT